ncbi:MAG: hypothetical protein A2817_03305 [Candidatus Yanofskybacteria bacterium RIFCSPHIGHO2_01_FULL_39_8b]|uniref:Short-chain dehydrogenase n=1 Tax=Candidatus Yanofskybacteria bacterium RIFCSPHIGHO2_01_FULL_39_8b TaxID=1802659 RepID=A0A1F8EEY1_9BACT|nr:MAG: hypothetical protein A2817_03305 [Candidatus Yanofskybacteria bacterium RIFCSPHIGHO2_01_FULL_39_8b]
MDLGLGGKTALITGSSRGIGRAIALCLAREGANVIICGRKYDKLLALEEKIISEHNVIVGSYKVDATIPESIEEMFINVKRDIGHIDILVNNIGDIEKFGNFFDLDDNDWINAYNLTFMSMVRFSKKTMPWLKKSSQASIINICSLVAHQPGRYNHHYVAAKAAMLAVSKQMANDLGPMGIRVNVICPSTLKDGGWARNVKDRANRDNISYTEAERVIENEAKAKSPLDKIGTADHVAALVAVLASDISGFSTGHCYNVDGGITRSIL